MQNRKGEVVSLYRSPSQTQDQFNDFLLIFEQLLSDINFLLIASDFNARTSFWWGKDSTASEGTELETFTCSYWLNQLVSSPTHILQNLS